MDDLLRPPGRVEVRKGGARKARPARPERTRVDVHVDRPKPSRRREGRTRGEQHDGHVQLEIRRSKGARPKRVAAPTDAPILRRPRRTRKRAAPPEPGRVVRKPARGGRGPRWDDAAPGRVEVHHDEAEHVETEPGGPLPVPALPDRASVDVRFDSDSVWTPPQMRRSGRKRTTARRKGPEKSR